MDVRFSHLIKVYVICYVTAIGFLVKTKRRSEYKLCLIYSSEFWPVKA